MFTIKSMVEQYKDSPQYIAGFYSGVVNGNESQACGHFTGRSLAECQSAYNYGVNPINTQPVHCSSVDTDANSCYNLGHDTGYSAAYKEIARCHMVDVPQASGHIGHFDAGFKQGWSYANAQSFRGSSGTYWNNCTKQYTLNKAGFLYTLGNTSGALYYDRVLALTLREYDNSTYEIRLQYPDDWSKYAKNGSAIVTFYSPTRDTTNNTYSAATVTLGHETTNVKQTLTDYAQSVVTNDYEKTFPAFKLLGLETNATLAGHQAYKIVGTYQDRSLGLQKIIEVGTVINGKAYYIQYIVDASRYSDYLPTLQHMIDSMKIKTLPTRPPQGIG
ncbi:MAG: hypothetical protein WBZ36_20710 [Candidatus Nitrosopolaris sp.]